MISINATLVVQIINLLVLILILNWIMYRPLKRMMAERAQTLAEGKAQAASLQEQTEAGQESYGKDLWARRSQIDKQTHQLVEEQMAQSQALIAEKQAEARQNQVQLRERIEQEMAQAKQQISQEAQLVALEMASRILDKRVS